MPATGLELLGSTRRMLLISLKRHRSASVEVLAQETFLTTSAIRQHLMALASQGTVQYTESREGPGRPKHLFSLTAAGEALFPQTYDALAARLLSAVAQEDDATKDRVFERVAEMAGAPMVASVGNTTGWERVDRMVAVLEELGYFPCVEKVSPTSARVTLLHCPISRLVKDHPEVCRSEEQWLSKGFGGSMRIAEHRTTGDGACAFVVDVSKPAPCPPPSRRRHPA